MPLNNELVEASFQTYPQLFDRMKALSQKYGGMSTEGMISAFTKVTGTNQFDLANPYIQNRRVKQVQSLPRDYTKDQVVEMIRNPDGNERPLREVAHGLEYTAYPQFHLRKVYQDLLTYHSYIYPEYAEESDTKNPDFFREWRLLEKLRKELNPAALAHRAAGQALLEGKVFYHPRVMVDKSHNSVVHAFAQQIPSDWAKIVGFNNRSKYTVAFNLFYFMQPGTNALQFGDLFLPYLDDFYSLVVAPPKGAGKSTVFASTEPGIDMPRFRRMEQAGKLQGTPDVYFQSGRWFYWVTLPVDSVFTFEVDDVNANAVSPFTGLFISMLQIAQYEQIQLELVQNPLIALVTGEIPYRNQEQQGASDEYKLSNAGRQLFEALWYQMLSQNNTSGIGFFTAPVENMTMHQLSEAPSANEISTNGYSYTIDKAGLAGIIPTSGDTRAGTANISFSIESRFAEQIYTCMERMMNQIFGGLNLKYDWRFKMFGTLASDKDTEDSARQGMTLGILSDQIIYLALHDRSILDDLAISRAIVNSGLMDLRLPLVSTYSAKQGESGLPPQAKSTLDPGGRPSTGTEANTDGQEGDLDSGV